MGFICHSKKRINCLMLILLLLFISACSPLFPNKTPYDYPGSIWESDDHVFYFQIEDEDPYKSNEYILIDDEIIAVVFFGDERSKDGSIIKKNGSETGEILFDVEWKCNDNKIELFIKKDYYNGDLEKNTIILKRVDEQ